MIFRQVFEPDTSTPIRQEMNKNPRLGGGRSREEFIALMEALDLPNPNYIDRALPANQSCGREPSVPQG